MEQILWSEGLLFRLRFLNYQLNIKAFIQINFEDSTGTQYKSDKCKILILSLKYVYTKSHAGMKIYQKWPYFALKLN